MADVTIGQLTANTPNKNSAIIPYSDGSTTYKTSPSGIVAASPGCVLQVKQVIKNDTFSTTSTSYVDIPGLSIDITPTNSSSKIMVMVNLGGTGNSTNSTNMFRYTRNGTALTTSSETWGSMFTVYTGTRGTIPASFSLLDSPNTTSSLNYKLQMRIDGFGATGTVNLHNTNANYTSISTMSVWEIAG